MDWARIKRLRIETGRPRGAWAGLDELIRIRYRARDFSFRPRQPVTSILAGRYASRLRGRGLDFEELRRYLPGDDIRAMEWRVTARTRQPYVRVNMEEKDRAVLLVVDQRLNMFFGARNRVKSVTAAELAALGAWRALDVGDRVGAVVFNDEKILEVRPQRSEAAVMTLLRRVLQLNHELHAESQVEPAPEKLNHALEAARRLVRHDMLVVIISDFHGVDAQSERLIADYHEEQQRIARFLRRLSAPLLMIDNQGDVVDQVRRLLGVPRRRANG